ncbi:MAG: hypothetical protein ABH817_00130 [archaeon]
MEEKKKEEPKKEEHKKKNDVDKSIKVFAIIIGILFILIILFFIFRPQLAVFVGRLQGEVFEYGNFEFRHEKIGKVDQYSTILELVGPGMQTYQYNFDLNNDPRELGEIPARLEHRLMTISFISFDKKSLECNNSMLVAWKLGEFMGVVTGNPATAAVADQETLDFAEQEGYEGTYTIKNCDDAINQNVILIRAGAETTQVYEEGSCIIIEAEDCRIVESSERFMLAVLDIMFLV